MATAAARGTGLLVDINIIPPELRPAGWSRLTLGLLLVVVAALGAVLIGYGLLAQARQRGDAAVARQRQADASYAEIAAGAAEAEALRTRIANAEAALAAMDADLRAFTAQVSRWGKALDAVLGKAVAGTSFRTIALEKGGIVVEGVSPGYDALVQYGSALQSSGLFARVAFRSLTSTAGTPVVPTVLPTPALAQTPAPTPTPTPIRTPTAIPTPAPTPTPTWTPSPYGYMVYAATRTYYRPDEALRWSVITGKAINPDGSLVPGLTFRLMSCCPVITMEIPRSWEPASDGTFEFLVPTGPTGWYFDLTIADASAETAMQLSTYDPSLTAGFYVWDVVFMRGQPNTPTPLPTATPTATPTAVATAATTPTPVRTVVPTPAMAPAPTATATPLTRDPVVFVLELTLGAGGGS